MYKEDDRVVVKCPHCGRKQFIAPYRFVRYGDTQPCAEKCESCEQFFRVWRNTTATYVYTTSTGKEDS